MDSRYVFVSDVKGKISKRENSLLKNQADYQHSYDNEMRKNMNLFQVFKSGCKLLS